VATIGNAGRRHRLLDGLAGQAELCQERQSRWFHWLERYGAKTMLLAWLPGIGDPLCTLGGWLRLPFWPSVAYMAIGKCLRYLTMTSLLLYVPDGVWHRIGQMMG
jgi:membrane protein YqaA with SNARE-associated domain